MAQTAVEWLKDMLEWNYGDPRMLEITWQNLDDLLERAKAMEKERVVNFCFECLRGDNIHTIKSNKELLEYIEQYYNETYNK